MKGKVEIKTPNGNGLIEEIYVSELGFLMVRVKRVDNQSWTTYNLGIHNPTDNIFTNALLPNTWLHQFIDSDKLWYLTEHHHEDGILSELFFETEKGMLTYITNNNITIDNG